MPIVTIMLFMLLSIWFNSDFFQFLIIPSMIVEFGLWMYLCSKGNCAKD